MLLNGLWQLINAFQVEKFIASINFLPLEFLSEIGFREGMGEGMSEEGEEFQDKR